VDAAPTANTPSSVAVDDLVESVSSQFLALLVIVFVLPLLILIAFLVKTQDGGPVIFRQLRIGQYGRPFTCYKFRTMQEGADRVLADLLAADAGAQEEWAQAFKLRQDPRVTPFGAFLRRSSLDELPQLFNILRGEMCFVGPRPIVNAKIPRFGHRFRHYCSVKPGLTGLWQVSGRNDLSYRTRVALDCLYAQKKCVGLNLWLVAMTIPAVLMRRGVY
jgi:lipopolysaccharide/colanic/teichoic acid biosynthesis glycosyltransferase